LLSSPSVVFPYFPFYTTEGFFLSGRWGIFSVISDDFILSLTIRHYFGYRSLLEMVRLLAKREGIEVIEVDPAYTSVIGMLKYAPQFMVSKDVAAAYVIARRGLGLKERIPYNYIAETCQEFCVSIS